MKKINILTIMAAIALTFGFASCGGEEVQESNDFELTATNTLDIQTMAHDTTALYPIHFSVTLEGGQLQVNNLTAHPVFEYPGIAADMDCRTEARIADFGEVKDLSKVDEIPAPGKFDKTAIAVEGNGYVLKAWGGQNINYYQLDELHDPDTVYMRLWLKKATADGFKVVYECPWYHAE